MKNNLAKKPNLLIVMSCLYIGGAERVAANLCRKIDRDKFNVTVCHLYDRGPVGELLYQEGFDIRCVIDGERKRGDYFSAFKLRRFILDNNIDIIHSHDMHSFIDCSLCKLMLPRIKFLHTFHFGNYPNQVKKYKRIEKLLWRTTNMLVAVGFNQKERIRQTYNIPDKRISVITNGVELPSGELNEKRYHEYKAKSKVVIGSISTLIEQKGIIYLIDTADKLRHKTDNFVFIIIGDGHLRSELEKKVHQLGLNDFVKFEGWVDNAAQNALPSFDIFFQPSLWEAMSMVILEAMMLGKPIVATNVGDNAKMIVDGKTGIVIDSKDVSAMTQALLVLINEPEKRRDYAASAKERALSKYTSDIMARQHENIYMKLLGKEGLS